MKSKIKSFLKKTGLSLGLLTLGAGSACAQWNTPFTPLTIVASNTQVIWPSPSTGSFPLGQHQVTVVYTNFLFTNTGIHTIKMGLDGVNFPITLVSITNNGVSIPNQTLNNISPSGNGTNVQVIANTNVTLFFEDVVLNTNNATNNSATGATPNY